MAQPLLYERVNLQGTLGLLELARRGMCRRFILGSSSSVYGRTSRAPFSEEENRLDPLSPYGVTKLAGEKLCYCFAHLYGLEVTCLRFFSVYGPRQRPDLVIHKFARAIEDNRPVTLFGDGSSRRDYTYVDDIVDGITAALPLTGRFEVFNLASGNPIPLKRMVHPSGESAGQAGPSSHAGDSLRPTCPSPTPTSARRPRRWAMLPRSPLKRALPASRPGFGARPDKWRVESEE